MLIILALYYIILCYLICITVWYYSYIAVHYDLYPIPEARRRPTISTAPEATISTTGSPTESRTVYLHTYVDMIMFTQNT